MRLTGGGKLNRGSVNSARGPENQDQNPIFRTLPTRHMRIYSIIGFNKCDLGSPHNVVDLEVNQTYSYR